MSLMAKNHRADILFLFGVLIAGWAVYAARDVLLLIYVSALFAVVISPVIGVVQKFRINGWRPGRGFALVVLMGGIALLLTAIFFVALPPIYNNAQEFASDWPKRLSALAHYLPFFKSLDAATLEKYGTEIVGGAEGLFRNVAGGIFGVFTGVILTAYFVIDGERAFEWAVSLFPAHQQARLTHTLLRAERRMRKWLLAQAVLMLCLGCCSLVVYFALGIKYFYLLALYACIANVVPVVGPLSSVALAGTVAAFDAPHKVVGVLIFYVVYQQIESAVISPRAMKSTLDLSPLAVIIALVLGGALAGVLGALVSVPTAALVAVFADEYLVQRRNPAVAAD